jgi:hypothetical protein
LKGDCLREIARLFNCSKFDIINGFESV